jgi:hypothetical protein
MQPHETVRPLSFVLFPVYFMVTYFVNNKENVRKNEIIDYLL